MLTREIQTNANIDPVCWYFNCNFLNIMLSNAEQWVTRRRLATQVK